VCNGCGRGEEEDDGGRRYSGVKQEKKKRRSRLVGRGGREHRQGAAGQRGRLRAKDAHVGGSHAGVSG